MTWEKLFKFKIKQIIEEHPYLNFVQKESLKQIVDRAKNLNDVTMLLFALYIM